MFVRRQAVSVGESRGNTYQRPPLANEETRKYCPEKASRALVRTLPHTARGSADDARTSLAHVEQNSGTRFGAGSFCDDGHRFVGTSSAFRTSSHDVGDSKLSSSSSSAVRAFSEVPQEVIPPLESALKCDASRRAIPPARRVAVSLRDEVLDLSTAKGSNSRVTAPCSERRVSVLLHDEIVGGLQHRLVGGLEAVGEMGTAVISEERSDSSVESDSSGSEGTNTVGLYRTRGDCTLMKPPEVGERMAGIRTPVDLRPPPVQSQPRDGVSRQSVADQRREWQEHSKESLEELSRSLRALCVDQHEDHPHRPHHRRKHRGETAERVPEVCGDLARLDRAREKDATKDAARCPFNTRSHAPHASHNPSDGRVALDPSAPSRFSTTIGSAGPSPGRTRKGHSRPKALFDVSAPEEGDPSGLSFLAGLPPLREHANAQPTTDESHCSTRATCGECFRNAGAEAGIPSPVARRLGVLQGASAARGRFEGSECLRLETRGGVP